MMTQLLFISLLFISCSGNTSQIDKSKIENYQEQYNSAQSDSLLVGIQSKIYNAFVQGLMSQKSDEINNLSKELEQLYNEKNQSIIQYWHSYLKFYSAIFYLKKGDKETAEKEIDKGIEWLKELKQKNSEEYALLAMLQGFSIQFNSMRAMFIGPEANKNAIRAIAIDSTNLRAYYVYASNDFYTPEKYGGGKEAEKYLLKAISLPVQKIRNDYLPSWGKEESYEMLIKFYIEKEKWGLAKQYFQEGIQEYPDSYNINQLASKLVGK